MPLWQLTQRPLRFAQAACLVTPLYRREMEVQVHHLPAHPPVLVRKALNPGRLTPEWVTLCQHSPGRGWVTSPEMSP